MRLRARFGLAVLAAAVPLLVAFFLLGIQVRGQIASEGVVEYARGVASAAGSTCTADARDGGPELHAYDAELRPLAPDAPALTATMIARARAGERTIVEVAEEPERRAVSALVRGRDDGACAWLLARRVGRTGPGPGVVRASPAMRLAAVLVLLTLGVVLLVLGGVIRRIRRLRDEVRAAAANNYRAEISIHGDDEVAELAQAFADSGRRIVAHLDAQERRERTLREFLANTTHDVMVPLTVLHGHLAALHKLGAASDPAVVRMAMQEADYIAALVHNLEVAARLDAGEPMLSRDPVDLCALVRRVAGRHTPLARRRGVEVVFAVPPSPLVTLGDLTLIEQAVGNLVQNAVLHNQAGGHVAVLLEQDDARTFRVIIKDDGPGISADERTRLLARGARGDEARTRHPHGKGLGLAISRRVADAHAWRFDLRPGAEGGLEVELVGELLADAAR